MNTEQVTKLMLSAYDDILAERMNEPLAGYIRERIMESVSPVIRIKQEHVSISINRDDYGYDDLIRFIIRNIDECTELYIDDTDILYWD